MTDSFDDYDFGMDVPRQPRERTHVKVNNARPSAQDRPETRVKNNDTKQDRPRRTG